MVGEVLFCLVHSKAIRLLFCFIDMTHELMDKGAGLIKIENNVAQSEARTNDPRIKSLVLYRLSKLGNVVNAELVNLRKQNPCCAEHEQ